MPTKKMTVTMPEELYKRVVQFPDTNWSALCRKTIEQELRIREAMADNDRVAALQEKAKADCSDLQAAGMEDALHYPIEEIDYRFLREFADRGRDYIECADTENLLAEFDQLNRAFHEDGSPAFRLRFPQNWEYKLGFIDGVLRLKDIAMGIGAPRHRASNKPKTSLFGNASKPISAD